MLNIYRNITPNISNGIHYYFTNFDNYIKELEPNLLAYIEPNTYRFNNNVFRLPLVGNIKEQNYKEITYIIDTITKICYLVNDVIYQSGYIELMCEIDYWGTYIDKAFLDKIEVLRCNRDLGTGIYDEIDFTNSSESFRFPLDLNDYVSGHPRNLSYVKAAIVYIVKYEKSTEGTWGSITASDMFYTNIDTINNAYVTFRGKVNPLDLASAFVGGIAKATIEDEGQTNANVTQAFIVPLSFIERAGSNNPAVPFDSYSKFGKHTIYGQPIKHQVKEIEKELTIDRNYNYYVGSPYDGLKIIRTNEPKTKIKYRITADIGGLRVIVAQNENQKDITNNFSVALTYNEGDVTRLGGILNSINSLSSIFASGFQIANGNLIAGAAGIGAGVSNFIAPFMKNNKQLGQIVGSGDGIVNMISNDSVSEGLGLLNPLGYMRFKSNDDEFKHAGRYGLTYNKYVFGLSQIFSQPLINTWNPYTYLQANMIIKYVPQKAAEIIKNKFSSGILLENI